MLYIHSHYLHEIASINCRKNSFNLSFNS